MHYVQSPLLKEVVVAKDEGEDYVSFFVQELLPCAEVRLLSQNVSCKSRKITC